MVTNKQIKLKGKIRYRENAWITDIEFRRHDWISFGTKIANSSIFFIFFHTQIHMRARSLWLQSICDGMHFISYFHAMEYGLLSLNAVISFQLHRSTRALCKPFVISVFDRSTRKKKPAPFPFWWSLILWIRTFYSRYATVSNVSIINEFSIWINFVDCLSLLIGIYTIQWKTKLANWLIFFCFNSKLTSLFWID